MIPETFETSELKLEDIQTSESLNTAFLRRVTQHGWSAGMQRSTQQHVSSQAVATTTASSTTREKGRRKEKEWEKEDKSRKRKAKKKEKGAKGERGRKRLRKQGKGVQEETDKEVKKDVTDWVEVRRRTRRKSRKMIQLFVKVDGGKTSMMEMEMSDKVDDIVKKIPISDQDVYVTSGGKKFEDK